MSDEKKIVKITCEINSLYSTCNHTVTQNMKETLPLRKTIFPFSCTYIKSDSWITGQSTFHTKNTRRSIHRKQVISSSVCQQGKGDGSELQLKIQVNVYSQNHFRVHEPYISERTCT